MGNLFDAGRQRMASITNQLALQLSQDLKGSLSDSDREFVVSSVPNIRNTREGARKIAEMAAALATRDQDFAIASLEARSTGNMQFTREWRAYSRTISVLDNMSFDEWKANADGNGLTRLDAQGNVIR
jgi:hypothetical protein